MRAHNHTLSLFFVLFTIKKAQKKPRLSPNELAAIQIKQQHKNNTRNIANYYLINSKQQRKKLDDCYRLDECIFNCEHQPTLYSLRATLLNSTLFEMCSVTATAL